MPIDPYVELEDRLGPLTGVEQTLLAFKAFDKWLEERPEMQLLDPLEQVDAYWAEQQTA